MDMVGRQNRTRCL